MQELTLVGVTEDGAKLLLTLPDGRRYALRIDERVRAATRGGAARSGQLAIPTETMRPKDIQARLRAGATPEEVAEVSGWPIERVESFAFPVLQERSFVAGQARDAFVRHLDGELELGEVVARRLAQRGVDESELRWDAWRTDEGQWTVLLAFPAGRGDQVATWIFDPESRTLHPIDDEARTLLAHEDAPAAPELVLAEPDEPGAQIVTLPPSKDRAAEMEGSRHPAMRRVGQDSRAHDEVPVQVQGPSGDSGNGADHGRGRRASVPSWDEILFGGGPNGSDQG
jgi:hypothetical protein